MDNQMIKGRYIASMTPRELGYELLDKAVSVMSMAKEAFEAGRFEEANRLLIQAQNIFLELGGALRGKDEASRHGAALFSLLTDRLLEVNINRNMELLEEIRQLTNSLKINYAAQMGKLRFD